MGSSSPACTGDLQEKNGVMIASGAPTIFVLMKCSRALAHLASSPRRPALAIFRTIESAVANAVHLHGEVSIQILAKRSWQRAPVAADAYFVPMIVAQCVKRYHICCVHQKFGEQTRGVISTGVDHLEASLESHTQAAKQAINAELRKHLFSQVPAWKGALRLAGGAGRVEGNVCPCLIMWLSSVVLVSPTGDCAGFEDTSRHREKFAEPVEEPFGDEAGGRDMRQVCNWIVSESHDLEGVQPLSSLSSLSVVQIFPR
ncbi:50s ribosomal protein [Cyclospora cayetanensis]|uniref:50s ribosomal protein n=1 Tax=Cyclospora cayetanensis TaxID=88456 RepID=A0A1D3D9D5_9EIME|nr:50s ribosomal protein [Cyclospora cayetanensis]